MKHVCVVLANGFEEIEGLTVVDLLRRADIQVTTASISNDKQVTGSHGIGVLADALFGEVDFTEIDMLVLPGGMPGTKNLQAHEGLTATIKTMSEQGKEIAAICAAPSVLGSLCLLKGKKACCYPGFEDKLEGAKVTYDPVAATDQIITSRGMGTAIPFALALIERLDGKEKADHIAKSIIYNV